MSTIIIEGGTLVNEESVFRGDILIRGDKIAALGDISSENIEAGAQIIDASGLIVMPGVIDDQVHFREPGMTHKGTIFSESRAAAAGGVTSYMEMPNTSPPTTTEDLLRQKLKLASETSFVNYGFYLGATNDNLDHLLSTDTSLYCGVKVFMGSSTGNMLVDNEDTLKGIFSSVNSIIACHCEDEKIIKENLEQALAIHGEKIPIDKHPLIRSREACLTSSSKAVELAREYGTRLHLLHLSTADELALLDDRPVTDEKLITAEACLHHLWFDDTAYEKRGSFVKWNPAIKGASDRKALIDGVNSDLIDIVATDHAPHTIDEKSNNYMNAPSGGPLVQHSLVAMTELYHRGEVTLETIVRKMCHNPATIFGIKERGFLRKGYKADIAIVDPARPQKVWYDNILYKCAWSPFSGEMFLSSVVTTIVNGTIVYDKGRFDEGYRGEALSYSQSRNS